MNKEYAFELENNLDIDRKYYSIIEDFGDQGAAISSIVEHKATALVHKKVLEDAIRAFNRGSKVKIVLTSPDHLVHIAKGIISRVDMGLYDDLFEKEDL